MMQLKSLRARLTVIILLPLLSIAALAGLWQLGNARETARDVFDRSLLSAALAVANDVAVSGGDALSPRTSEILSGTSGGPVFYHVYAPDGVIVAGYATPPVGIPTEQLEPAQPAYLEASYLGREVSGVRLQFRTEVDGFSGIFTTTVWQDSAVRTDFVRALVSRSFIAISTLIVSLALVVWFGISFGLRPLIDLQNAIDRRSTTDLSPIRRSVPVEAQGIVSTLNRLFGQVTQAMSAQSEFIANAAHQLRNPIAGVLALAESVVDAPDAQKSKERARDLLDAARETADLSQKLLLLERADALTPQSAFEPFDLTKALSQWVKGYQAGQANGPSIVEGKIETDVLITGDQTMIKEAVTNLVNNATQHGGPPLSKIEISLMSDRDAAQIVVEDDGHGLEDADMAEALMRFSHVSDTSSSGLGLSIVAAVAEGHGGRLELSNVGQGLIATITLPMS